MSTTSILYTIGQKTKTELDKKLNLAGGTMTGALTLSGAPTSNLHAATKAYVDTVASSGSSTQSELDTTQTGAGLQTDGTYSANSSANYISGAFNLVDADNKLDTQVKANADAISSNDSDISTLQSSLSTAESDIDSLESNMSTAQSDISTLQSNVASNDSDISTLQSNVSSNDSDIAALQSSLSTAESNITSNDTDISNLQTATGSLAADGNSATFSGNVSAAAISGTNLSLSGNLTVSGTTTTVDTTNLDVADSIMNLSKGASTASTATNDGGFVVERGSSENNVALIWDEGVDMFQVLSTSATAATSDISGTDASASLASFNGDLYQNGTSVGSVSDFESGLTGGTSGSGS